MERRSVELILQGKSNREICKALKLGDRKVRRTRALAQAYGYLSGAKPLPAFPEAIFPLDEPADRLATSPVDQVLLNKKDWINERLALGWRPVTVWEELGCEIKRSSFYRFLNRHKLEDVGQRARLIPEIRHAEAEAMLVDWGKLRTVVGDDGKKRTLWAFVGVLGFSRYMMVRLVWTNDVATTILTLESMLREIGGAPRRVTSDNPKCFALKADKYEPLLNPVLERWSAHYGLTLECLPPYDPQKKGKVERLMPYVRRLYEAHGDSWHGLEESQSYINKKALIANQRKHGTTGLRPVEVLDGIERARLKPLPAVGYELEEFHEGIVRKDGYVRFRGKYYSVGCEHVDLAVIVLGGKEQVSIYAKGKLLETHARINDPHTAKSTKQHHLLPHERTMLDGAFYIKRGEKMGPHVACAIGLILASGDGFVDLRKVWGILSLDKEFSGAAINRACELAIEMGSISYTTIARLARMQPGAAGVDVGAVPHASKMPGENKKQAETKRRFVRDLNEYKQFLSSQGRGGSNEPADIVPAT